MSEIINKVATSTLVTLDLEDVLDKNTERLTIDLAENLFQGLVLREKDFREFIKVHDWAIYNGAYVNVFCSADAIIPNWAYMLVASKLSSNAKNFVFGPTATLEQEILRQNIIQINSAKYQDAKIVIKGCSDLSEPEFAFFEITKKLAPVVSSIMYGEPCSTVPVFKKKK
jgi:S-adenosylmethionine/arginine decarboxylase-like enzyme